MAKTLIEKLNELTENEFDYLKVTSADVNIRLKTIDINIIYPAEKETHVNTCKEKVSDIIVKILKSSATVNVKFKKSHFDFEFFKAALYAFLNAYPSIASTISDKDVSFNLDGQRIVVLLKLEKSVYDYCVATKVSADIDKFVRVNYCEDIHVELCSKNETNIDVADISADSKGLSAEFKGGRSIRPENVEDFIGPIVYDEANYIEDIKSNRESATLCGTVGKILEILRKPKPDAIKPVEKKFYKFTLTDFTGSINCVYFPSQKTINQMGLLQAGKQIVCRGAAELDTFKNDGSFTYRLRDISLCTLPKDFTVNRLKMDVPDRYKTVFPQAYVEEKQVTLFDTPKTKEDVPVYAIGKTFCVFDLETTGLSAESDRIIEIGAVKVVDGKVTETFSSMVDPLIPLPDKIKTLTHIEDADVKGQPLIADVLPDFYKFSHGTILVGQNIPFDYGFISAKGKPLGIFFDNDKMDTIPLARKYYPQIGKYNLDSLAKFFGVINQGAHRAIYDAFATADIFLKIIKNIV